ncbi:MAG: hypothetical protein KDC92_15030, partial [Bacteroidetes bacterium]|nr:hypothetical protein [Bacteroidota bacterium]
SAFQLDIHLEKGDFAYPQNTGKIEEKTTDENTKTFYGTMGTNKSPSSSLEIFGEDTDVNLTIK